MPGRVRMQHTALLGDPHPCTLPVPLHRCSPHFCADIQSTELSLQQASLHHSNVKQLSPEKDHHGSGRHNPTYAQCKTVLITSCIAIIIKMCCIMYFG